MCHDVRATGNPERFSRSLIMRAGVAVGIVSAILAGCSAGPAGDRVSPAAPPGVALGLPGPGAGKPLEAAEMLPGTAYRFADLLPGVLDVDLTAAQPGIFSFPSAGAASLAGDADAATDVVNLLAAQDVALLNDPYIARSPGSTPDPARDLTLPPLDELLDRISSQPFLTVTAPERSMTIAGRPATAVEVSVPPLPSNAVACGPGAPPCAVLYVASSGFGQSLVSGQRLRLAMLDHPTGPILVVQNIEDPRAQQVIDSARFVEHVVPTGPDPVRSLPYTRSPLQAGQTYGAALTAVGVGVTFTTGAAPAVGYTKAGANLAVISADVPPDVAAPSVLPYVASTEKLFGYVAASLDLLIPDPGVDPRIIGPTAFERSKGRAAGGEGGLVDLLATQPWAEVVAAAAPATVAGLPARSIDVRLRAGTGSVPCTLSTPAAGNCAVLLYGRNSSTLWLLSDRVLRVAELTVGRRTVTVVTSADEPGQALLGSLRIGELPT